MTQSELSVKGLEAARAILPAAVDHYTEQVIRAYVAALATPPVEAEAVAYAHRNAICGLSAGGEYATVTAPALAKRGDPDTIPLFTHPPAAQPPDDIREALTMAKTRLEQYADAVNAGHAQGGGRELKRKIWGAFQEFDAILAASPTPPDDVAEAMVVVPRERTMAMHYAMQSTTGAILTRGHTAEMWSKAVAAALKSGSGQ
jgi:hypothetical protein